MWKRSSWFERGFERPLQVVGGVARRKAMSHVCPREELSGDSFSSSWSLVVALVEWSSVAPDGLDFDGYATTVPQAPNADWSFHKG